MQFHRLIVLAYLLLGGCQSAPVEEKPPALADQQWHVSTLSPETIAKADAAVLDYRQCLGKETLTRSQNRGDPRDITNQILQSCENRLPAIKAAFDTENVPPVISERKIRQTRSQGVQSVLRSVSAVQAQRVGDEEEAKIAAQQKKSKPEQNR
jgi:hypothetical protein